VCIAAVGSDRAVHLIYDRLGDCNVRVGFKSLITCPSSSNSSIVRRGHLRGHTARINDVAIDASGKILATTSDDCTMRLWDIHAVQQTTALRLNAPGIAVQFHPANPNGGEVGR